MRRYRKGQIFRPPTAAESAANADALEGFRRRPPESQVRLGRGDKVLVKTPTGGIPARDGTTISSAICTKLVETSTAEEKTLIETDEEIEVFNLDTADVSGDSYVQTGLTLHGTRCIEIGFETIHAELTAKLEPTSSDTAATATAKRLKWNMTTEIWTDAGEADFTVQVRDHDAWGVTGERGLVRARQADSGVIWETVTPFGQMVYQAKLDTILNAGSFAMASIYTGTTPSDSGENFTVYASDLFSPGSIPAGRWIYVQWFRTERKFLAVGSIPRDREFELKYSLAKGGTAVAHGRDFIAGAWVTDTDVGAEFTVEDIHSEYLGRGKDVYASPFTSGSYGRARLVDGSWEIVRLTPHALKIKALINMSSGLLTTDANITIDTVTITQPEGAILYAGPITSVTNVLSLAGDDNGIVYAEWNQNLAVWEGVPACPA